VSDTLTKRGVPHIKANAGFFLFANLGKWARLAGGEMELWMRMIGNGVYFALGRAFHLGEEEDGSLSPLESARIGWFRIGFAVDREIMELALQRLLATLDQVESI
jgi:hypothetical protein